MRLLRVADNARLRLATVLPYTVALFAAVLCPLSSGQNFASSITGTVTDPTGSAVVGAKVELKNMGTNDVRDTISGDNGSYQFNNLIPGTYQVDVTAAGFKSFSRQNLILTANTNATVNVSLELGATEQKVEVTSAAVLIDNETANNSVTLDTELMENLPNATRNPLNFVFAVAGTTIAPGGQTQKAGTLDQMSSNFGMNGGRTGDEAILIDGAPSQAVDWGGLIVSPLQDSIQEQQIVQNTYDAQYQRAGAGIVTLISKGGSNQFHGEAYDYLQNSYFNANSWYNNEYGIARQPFKQNQFGGNVGGPILKRWKLYFFGGYEGLRQPNTQSTGLITVPTQAERNGDFSQAFNANGGPDVIYNPFSTTATPNNTSGYTRTPFPGNVIPSDLINSVGQKIVNLYPLPNRPGTGPNDLNNYYAQGPGNTLNDKMDLRFDWNQSNAHRLFFRWSERFREDILLPCFFCNGADTGVNQTNNGFEGVINDTVTPDPTWVINSYFSYGRWRESHIAQGYGVASASTIGLANSLFQAPILPTIYPDNGYSSLSNSSYENYIRYSSDAEVNVTKELSKHTLKFGANFDVQMINSISEAVGSFDFSSALTSCDPNSGGGPCNALNTTSTLTGNPIASMLLGTASGGGQAINIDPAMSLHTYGTYIQDQWRITPKLTINAGLRYENQRPATERFNRLMYFNPNVVNPISSQVEPLLGRPVNGEFQYASSSNRYAWPPDNTNFAPRAGLAYKITDRFVARAGAGIFFLPPSAMITFDNPGEFYGFSASTPYIATTQNGFVPLNLVNSPFPYGINQPTGSSQGGLTLVGNGLGQIWLSAPHPTPYTEQWSFDLQYQLGAHSAVEAGYTGNRGRKLLYGNPNLDLDQMPDQYLSLGPALDAQVANPFYNIAPAGTYLGTQPTIAYNELLRPFPQYTYLQITRSLPGARSSFNALYVKYNHNFSSGLSLLATYQWSKAMDNGPEDYFGWATGNSWRDAYNTMLDYNISTHDVPQDFVTSLVYELPYGKGKHWGNNAPLAIREIAGNWQISTVVTFASGLPIGPVIDGYNNHLNDYGYPGPLLPDLLSTNVAPTNRSPTNWVNPVAYLDLNALINAGDTALMWTLGNAPERLTQLRERAERNVDLSLAKNFGGERYQVWLRGEALNLTNYAQYNNFCLDLTQSSCGPFGQAYGTENLPRLLQLSLKVMF